jgi:hypothetical protein
MAEKITMTKQLTVEDWLAIQKEETCKIHSSTAEWGWCYARMGDPYDVRPELSDEYDVIGREYFARRPGSQIWVAFSDLPEDIRSALSHRPVVKLPFPPGRARTRLAELVHGLPEKRRIRILKNNQRNQRNFDG